LAFPVAHEIKRKRGRPKGSINKGGRKMVNEKSETIIELDRPRTLKLTFNAFCDAEGVVGHSVLRQDLGLSEIRALLWAGLKHEDRTLTIQKVGELLGDGAKMAEVMNVVASAVNDFFAAGEAEGVGDTPTG
jgi:hypothetical protein